MYMCMKAGGGGGFELGKRNANKNKTKFDYRLITSYTHSTIDYVKNLKVASLLENDRKNYSQCGS